MKNREKVGQICAARRTYPLMATDVSAAQAQRSQLEAEFIANASDLRVDLIRFVRARIKNGALAEEVVQESLFVAWRGLAGLRDTTALRKWVFGIAHYLTSKVRRRERDTMLLGAPGEGDRVAVHDTANAAMRLADELLDEERLRGALANAIGRLPEDARACILLFYGARLSTAAIAARLGLKEPAVHQRLHRARAALLEQMAPLQLLAAPARDAMAARRRRRARIRRLAPSWLSLLFGTGPSAVASHQSRLPLLSKVFMSKAFLPSVFALSTALIAGRFVYANANPGHRHDSNKSARSGVQDRSVGPSPSATKSPAPSAKLDPKRLRDYAPSGTAPSASRPSARGTAPATASAPPALQVNPAGGLVMECPDCAPVPDEAVTLSVEALQRYHAVSGPSRGPADAPVTVTMFVDFACPFCADVLGTLDQIWDEYPGKLRLVIKQMPVHASAKLAAAGALAAHAQGKFWEFHDAMIANHPNVARAAVLQIAQQVGLQMPAFVAALDAAATHAAVEAEFADAKALGARGTPAFIINGKLFTGARKVPAFRKLIDSALLASPTSR